MALSGSIRYMGFGVGLGGLLGMAFIWELLLFKQNKISHGYFSWNRFVPSE